MSAGKARGIILFLSFLALFLQLAVEQELLACGLSAASLLLALVVLWRNLPQLTDVSAENPKLKSVRAVTVFNVVLLVLCAIWAILTKTGVWQVSQEGEEQFAVLLVACFMLFTGIIAPKLPFSRHTGLRLPWTVSDEETWIVAHRILGYLSIPMALFYLTAAPLAGRPEVLTVGVILVWIGVPGALSLLFYRRKLQCKR